MSPFWEAPHAPRSHAATCTSLTHGATAVYPLTVYPLTDYPTTPRRVLEGGGSGFVSDIVQLFIKRGEPEKAAQKALVNYKYFLAAEVCCHAKVNI